MNKFLIFFKEHTSIKVLIIVILFFLVLSPFFLGCASPGTNYVTLQYTNANRHFCIYKSLIELSTQDQLEEAMGKPEGTFKGATNLRTLKNSLKMELDTWQHAINENYELFKGDK